MLPKVIRHFGWADSNDNDCNDSSELSASIVKNVRQEMFKHHYLLQEVITPNYSGHFTEQQLKFWTFLWVQSIVRIENAQGLCFRSLLKISLLLSIVFTYCFLSFSEHCLAYKTELPIKKERSQAAHRLEFCEN